MTTAPAAAPAWRSRRVAAAAAEREEVVVADWPEQYCCSLRYFQNIIR